MEQTRSLGLRRGAWSREEDLLLKRCIETHGPSKWHLVPKQAGLNRCRKSCRLRWLNYLQPDLNREEFKEDEVDLLIKLHKLLGNRWSLIAARLPGRTANDVKNYWNSHLRKKLGSKLVESPPLPRWKKHEVIKPKPMSFNSKLLSWDLINYNNKAKTQHQNEEEQKQHCMLPPTEGQNMWWNELLVEDDIDYSMGETAEAMDSNRMEFDGSVFAWDHLLKTDNW